MLKKCANNLKFVFTYTDFKKQIKYHDERERHTSEERKEVYILVSLMAPSP